MINWTARLTMRVLLSAFLICAGNYTALAQSATRPVAEEKVLNIHIWTGYFASDTLANFEKETGIKVVQSDYVGNRDFEARLARGNTGYDIVVPPSSLYERQIRAGYYQKLDKSRLPNLKNMDPDIQAALAMGDPGNEHAVLHMWGTIGMAYNVKLIQQVLPDAPLDSWRLLFDPKRAAKLQQCGVSLMDSATTLYSTTLNVLGKDPNSQKAEDIEVASRAMAAIRPAIRHFDTDRIVSELSDGKLCLAVNYNGDLVLAQERAKQQKTGQEIVYRIPKEGAIMWMDSYLIPKDAPHPKNAHAFINYMLRPEVIAAVTNTLHFANGNAKAAQYVNKEVLDDPNIYPSPQVKAKLFPDLGDTEEALRLMTRNWEKFKNGK